MSSDPNNTLGKSEIELGEQAVQWKIIDEIQLAECINIQAKLREMGLVRSLPEILIEKGYVPRSVWERIERGEALDESHLVADLPSDVLSAVPADDLAEVPEVGPGTAPGEIAASPVTAELPPKSHDQAGILPKDEDLGETWAADKDGLPAFEIPEELSRRGYGGALSLEFSESLMPEGSSFSEAEARAKKAECDAEEKTTWPRIPGYELLSVLGKGGMGKVFKGLQLSMQREVAIKVLDPKLSENVEFVERFVREARAVAQLSHENIIAGIDAGKTEDNVHYFVMEFIRGETVSKILERQSKLPVQDAVKIACQIARALQHAHEHGIIHRDIKPENIMMDGDVAKLCDLGLVKDETRDSKITIAGVALGTPHYISPEQARGEKDIDIRSDIYSLGASLYHMVVGNVPFPKNNPTVVCMMHATQAIPDPKETDPDIPESVCKIIRKCTAKEKGRRYQKPVDLVKDLARCIQGKKEMEAKTPVAKPASGDLELLPLDGKKPVRAAPPQAKALSLEEEDGEKTVRAAPPQAKAAPSGKKYSGRKRSVRHAAPAIEIATAPEHRGLTLVLAIVAAMIVLGGTGYLVYPVVEGMFKEPPRLQVDTPVKTAIDDKVPAAQSELLELEQHYRFHNLKDEAPTRERLAAYERLLEKYQGTPAANLVRSDAEQFQTKLERVARDEYQKFSDETEQYRDNLNPLHLRKVYDLWQSYPESLQKFTSLGKDVRSKMQIAEENLDKRITEDLAAAQSIRNDSPREAWTACERIAEYALPSQLEKTASQRREIYDDYQSSIRRAESRYGDKFNRAFHGAVLEGNYSQAKKTCETYRADRSYYGMWERVDMRIGDIALLEEVRGQFQDSEIGREKKISREDALAAIPKLASPEIEETRRLWVLGVLLWHKQCWEEAGKCFGDLPPSGERDIYLAQVATKMKEAEAQAKWQEAQAGFQGKKFLMARELIEELAGPLRNTDFVQARSKEIEELRRDIESAYLQRYAVPLYANGEFTEFPTPENKFAFTVLYRLNSEKELEDFVIADYGCRIKTGDGWEVSFDKPDALFEAYWKWKLKSFREMKVEVRLGKSPSVNVGLSLYKQEPVGKSDSLRRYLYLLYYDPNQMCRAEIFNKADVYRNYPQYQPILTGKSGKVLQGVLCFTDGNAGRLPDRISEVVLAKAKLSKKREWTLSSTASSGKIKFDWFSCKCDLFREGYFGLYANGPAIFSELTISGQLEESTAKEIANLVVKNKKTYLTRKVYWQDY